MVFVVALIVIYLASAIYIGFKGQNRKIGWLRTLIVSIFLTPIVGYIAYLKSSKDECTLKVYKCKRCEFIYTEKHSVCPLCAKDGLNIFVNEKIMKESTI